MIGTRLAHYEITAHLGSGGMGDVYQASDSKLGRTVAIKFLPEAFAHDGDRVARFQREARVLASLNHPNVAAIYGVEEAGGRHFLVMELVPGETLEERIRRGAIPLAEALPIAKQVADGLEEAHEAGIVHRDLKPANIKITADDKVKVLDFGLAKAAASEPSSVSLSMSPTVITSATSAGVIMGTAPYMSPEQARGRDVDSTHRHLGLRRRPVPDADRQPHVRWRHGHRHAGEDSRTRAGVGAVATRHATCSSTTAPALSDEEPEEPAAVDRRCAHPASRAHREAAATGKVHRHRRAAGVVSTMDQGVAVGDGSRVPGRWCRPVDVATVASARSAAAAVRVSVACRLCPRTRQPACGGGVARRATCRVHSRYRGYPRLESSSGTSINLATRRLRELKALSI